ncbi:MAG TPA: methyltransferase domain-containing protein [Nitrospira sp.]|nr:methyltransferase domain-containing protein [Nitrospira sp.]
MGQRRQDLEAHLEAWGLRQFTSDEAYFRWQRQALSTDELTALHEHAERKRHGMSEDETAFYDLSAAPRIFPVLYSQRYDYYAAIGPLVAGELHNAATILDFGCGPGILTTFYARRYPQAHVVGVDRSRASLAVAQQKAEDLHLDNVTFEYADVEAGSPGGTYDCVVATHALVQSEQDVGLPSATWRTFDRARDPLAQSAFEQRTGLGVRLDRLTAALRTGGTMIVFEKTRQLARRIPLQRALAARALHLVQPPQPIRYSLVEDISDDGPLYVLRKAAGGGVAWDEHPEPDPGRPFDRAASRSGSSAADVPVYENHWPSAQRAWEQLSDKTVMREDTSEESDGRQLHVELGTAEGLRYLYCANTFDQRQLVMVQPAGAAVLHTYYQEIIQGSA